MWQQVKQYFQNWLRKPAEMNAINPLEQHQLLERSTEEVGHFVRWKKGGGSEQLTDRLRHGFNMHRAGLEQEDDELDFMEFQSTSGFIIHLKDDLECAKESACIQDHLRDKVLALGYRLATSERRTRTKNDRQEVIDRHVLKPPLDIQGGRVLEQRFGTITIEVLTCKATPCNLKFITTYYTGRNYRPALPFGDLMEHLIC